MAIINLSSPWIIFYRKVEAMFKKDPEIRVVFDGKAENYELKMFVDNNAKAEALSELLPPVKTFGDIDVKVTIIPTNNELQARRRPFLRGTPSLYDVAFRGNRAYCYEMTTSSELPFDIHYVVFAKEVVQFRNDDIGDVNGLCSTLYQEIAKDIFIEQPKTHYCTNTIYEHDTEF